MRVTIGDFVVHLTDAWKAYVDAPLHPASLGFHDRPGPHELVLNAERVPVSGRTREHVVETYVRGKVLTNRRASISAMAAGALDDQDVVGPVRSETSGVLVGARQWAHTGDGSIVVAVFAAELAPDAFSCLAISVICGVAVDLELAVERLMSAVIAGVEVRRS
jgi:hypothetical protein